MCALTFNYAGLKCSFHDKLPLVKPIPIGARDSKEKYDTDQCKIELSLIINIDF